MSQTQKILLPIVLSDRINKIEIKDTTLSGFEAIKFRNLISVYFQILGEQKNKTLEVVKDSKKIQFQTKKAVLDARIGEASKIKDDRLRKTKLEAIEKEVDILETESNNYANETIATSENMMTAFRENTEFEDKIGQIDIEFKEKSYQKEIEICKLICSFLEPELSKTFDFNRLSATAPQNLILSVLENKENDCNDFFMKWSETKNQTMVQNQN